MQDACLSNRILFMSQIAPLDRIDFDILRHLRDDARLSNKELAARIGLAPSTCLGRVRRLVDQGALVGFHAELDPGAAQVGLQALMLVALTQHSRDRLRTFQDHVASLEEVVQAFHVSGKYDYILHVAVRDSDHLRDLALDSFTTREEVSQIETSLVFDRLNAGGIPVYGGRD